MKTYSSRSSATQALKKIGVPTKNYNTFITKNIDGKYDVDLDAAKKSVGVAKKAATKKVTSKKKTTSKKKAPAKKKAASSDGRPSVSKRCQDLINAGKTNEQIWDLIQDEYGLDDAKKYYPAWNRSHMRRNGLLSKKAKAA